MKAVVTNIFAYGGYIEKNFIYISFVYFLVDFN